MNNMNDTVPVTTITTDTGNITFDSSYNVNPSTITISDTIPTTDIDVDGDIKIQGQSLKDFMDSVNDRLAILQPNPDVLEKYDALKEAYDHYKLLEKICLDKHE